MERENWYLLNSGTDVGAANMAIDEALCRQPADRPVLRFFRWDPYCVSLGYGQKVEALDREKCRQNGIDIVRRPTGGRAVLHADEVTYAVIIPVAHPLAQLSVMELYKTLSGGLADGLRFLGVDVQVKKSTAGEPPYTSSELCFASTGRYEIVAGDRKIVGSAQRRFQQAVLQHGSVLTGFYHLTLDKLLRKSVMSEVQEHTASVSEIMNRDVSYGEVVEALSHGFETALHATFQPLELTPDRIDQVNRLMPKYLEETTRELNSQVVAQ